MGNVYIFDAYGTLFDVASGVMRHGERVGANADRLAEVWRTKQLEYSWVRTLMERRKDFRALTEDALDFALAECGIKSAEIREMLVEAYADLSAYPDARSTLDALKSFGCRTAILSNGTAAMLERATRSAGLVEVIDEVISVDEVDTYKTAPKAYRLALDRLAVRPHDVSFVSSNRWDVAGATAFGFASFWINRTGKPDEYADLPPVRMLDSLIQLAEPFQAPKPHIAKA